MKAKFNAKTQNYIDEEARSAIKSQLYPSIVEYRAFQAQNATFFKSAYIDLSHGNTEILACSEEFEKFAQQVIKDSDGAIKAVSLSKQSQGVFLYAETPGLWARLIATKMVMNDTQHVNNTEVKNHEPPRPEPRHG